MELISKIKQNAKYSHDFLKENSEVYQMYNDLNLKAFQDGLIERKYKELIGLGIAIVVNCESCIYWHISSLFKLGCKYEELLEVFEVAIEMGGGPAMARNQRNLKILDIVYGRYKEDKIHEKKVHLNKVIYF